MDDGTGGIWVLLYGCLGAPTPSGCVRMHVGGLGECCSCTLRGRAVMAHCWALELILVFLEMSALHLHCVCGTSSPVSTCSCSWELRAALCPQPAASKLEAPPRADKEKFLFVYSKLSYISLYISCIIIPYTGLAFLLMLGFLSFCCITQPSPSGPAFA